MDIENNEEYSLALQKFFDNNVENIITSATVNRALIDKVSTEIVEKKVDNQSNSIKASMFQINPKFNEKSKHYDTVKNDIDKVLTDYEVALTKCSDKYDTQLEELLIKKVDLESNLIEKIFKEEKFKNDENIKEKEKTTDKLKTALEEKNKKIFDFIFRNKKKSDLDIQDIRKLEDSFDLEKEQSNKLDKNIKKIQDDNKTNMSEIAKIEIDLENLDKEIEKLSNIKRVFLEEAMETKNKELSKTVKKPSAILKITRFFSNRFNTYKVIENSVIEPLRIRVSEFEEAIDNN